MPHTTHPTHLHTTLHAHSTYTHIHSTHHACIHTYSTPYVLIYAHQTYIHIPCTMSTPHLSYTAQYTMYKPYTKHKHHTYSHIHTLWTHHMLNICCISQYHTQHIKPTNIPHAHTCQLHTHIIIKQTLNRHTTDTTSRYTPRKHTEQTLARTHETSTSHMYRHTHVSFCFKDHSSLLLCSLTAFLFLKSSR